MDIDGIHPFLFKGRSTFSGPAGRLDYTTARKEYPVRASDANKAKGRLTCFSVPKPNSARRLGYVMKAEDVPQLRWNPRRGLCAWLRDRQWRVCL